MHFYSIRPTMYQLCKILFQISEQGVLCRRTGKYFLSHLRIFIIKKEKKIKVHIIYIYIYYDHTNRGHARSPKPTKKTFREDDHVRYYPN